MRITAAVLRAADAPYAIERVDKVITSYPLSQLHQAEADATSAAAVKPVLIRTIRRDRLDAVGTETNGPARRGRPPDPDIERRVLAAALTVYGEVGWAGFTRDRVARRAPVGKAALYRRWPTKEDLLLAALEHLAEPPGEGADLTDLRGCLIGMAGQVIDMFVGPKALVLPRVLIEASQYPPQFDDMVQNIVRARFTGARALVQAAVDRGELPPATPPDLIIDAIMGRVISLIVLTPGARRVTISAGRDHYAASITDFVLAAVTRSSVVERS